ncbi:MAG: UvrD-helicase domain-containing protein, partial [Pseudomonadota bacterium]
LRFGSCDILRGEGRAILPLSEAGEVIVIAFVAEEIGRMAPPSPRRMSHEPKRRVGGPRPPPERPPMIDPNHPASRAQITAATPQNSTWVSANAGSGKTRVLTDRVARLLLSGTDPMQILCLTYTKAAAAEMQNRLFKRLGTWAMMGDAELRGELRQLDEETSVITAENLRAARTLFARALETPGGLKIQTIHAFCDRLLRRFPLEAGVPPGFEMLEERQAAQLQADILDAMVDRPSSPLSPLSSRGTPRAKHSTRSFSTAPPLSGP